MENKIERKIKVFIDNELVGKIQSIQLHTLYVYRMLINKKDIGKIFTKKCINPISQKKPLQIVIEENGGEVMKIHNIWMRTVNHNLCSFHSDEWVIIENFDMEYEYISGLIESCY